MDDTSSSSNKRKRGQETNEDNSIDSEDYERYINEVRDAQRKIDPKVMYQNCHDLRMKLRSELWGPFFLGKERPVLVEQWAYGIAARLDAIKALVRSSSARVQTRSGDDFQRLIGSAIANQHALSCGQMIHLFEKEFGIDFSSAIVPLSDEGYVLWVFNSNDDNDVTL